VGLHSRTAAESRPKESLTSGWLLRRLVKLSVAEADSAQFQHLAGVATRIVTATIARLKRAPVFAEESEKGDMS